ncbi:hypothetical protein Y032_0199g1674 [Ancylostoma ceylanicum]|uniref:Uncharacterized protein n=1 Tax=Ancylostoma ceylanicum TaxID=53326 RepID=A0A016SNX2_9BILA|nr:hypothetical protein Y032_0199g1674 [Ancylostoma ceylanicum]
MSNVRIRLNGLCRRSIFYNMRTSIDQSLLFSPCLSLCIAIYMFPGVFENHHAILFSVDQPIVLMVGANA